MSDVAIKEKTGSVDKAPLAKPVAWRVSVRHTPLNSNHKTVTVQAITREEAWWEYLKVVANDIHSEEYKQPPFRRYAGDGGKHYHVALAWLADVQKAGMIPDDVEILTEDYLVRRKNAMRIRGTIRPQDVDGFTELASAPG